ncbi:MAG: wax ester/triacylglycerol synthase family O-acyltransferase [Deltaproteobacteria bacterium]|jgi:WS/DGAT/MGAT family acyltransferase|nr:wax ester/triacylglycerol synthase family O-acyltransferase [Deltaproteobacteria bacterium]
MASYDRLGIQDQIFLDMENRDAHMHVAGCLLFDATPLRTAAGGIDFERICDYVESRLHRIPRYRQRVQMLPVGGNPIWVDDPRFNLRYHVRHTHLPPPGDERQLKRLIGRILSQALDRGKPLWEMWIVDGLQGDRFAVITKVHHCVTDGVGSLELLASLLTAQPNKEFAPGPIWLPRATPDRRELLRDTLSRYASTPLAITRELLRAARKPRESYESIAEAVRGIMESRALTVEPASETPLNQPVGPHRRFDWLAMDLDAVKDVKNRLGVTVNDVALATITGALSRFLALRGVTPHQQRDLDFRCALPVNMRAESQYGELGNRVANLFVKLPLAEQDPIRRLEIVSETMAEAKDSDQLLAMGAFERLGELTHPSLLTYYAVSSMETLTSNFVFTNVPGPQSRWHLLDALLEEVYPAAPCLPQQAVAVALMSYCGGLYWGFNSDWELVPDLHELVLAVETAFQEICDAASGKAARAGGRAL